VHAGCEGIQRRAHAPQGRKQFEKTELAALVKQTLLANGRRTVTAGTDANDNAAEILNRRSSLAKEDASNKRKRVINEHMSIREFMDNQSTKVTVSILDRAEQEWRKYREESKEDEGIPLESGYLERREFLNKVDERGERRPKVTILKDKKKRKY